MPWFWNRPERPSSGQPRADRHGDLLPTGAIARLGTNRLQHVVDRGNEGICAIVFSPDGRLLAIGGRDGRVSLWEADTGRLVRVFGRFADETCTLAFSPDGKRLGAGGNWGEAWVWDTASGSKICELPDAEERGNVYAIAFSPQGHLWATASSQGVSLWNVQAHPRQAVHLRLPAADEEDEMERYLAVAFSPDGTRLAAASSRTIRAEQIDEDKLSAFMMDCPDPFEAMNHPDYFLSKMREQQERMMEAMKDQFGDEVEHQGMGFTFSGGQGWRIGEEGRLTVWQLPSGQQEVTWNLEEGAPYLLAFARDSNVLASIGRGVQTWDVRRKRRLAPGQVPAHWQSSPGCTPYGVTILLAEEIRGEARLWDLVGQRQIRALDRALSWGPFAFSPQGDRLAVTNGRDTVEITDTATGRTMLPLERHLGWIDAISFATGERLAVLSGGEVYIWDRKKGILTSVLPLGARAPMLAPGGAKVAIIEATQADDARVVVLEMAGATRLVELEGLEPTVLAFADDDTLLIGNQLGQVGRYDLHSRKWVKILRGIEGAVVALSFSAKMQLLAAGSDDGLVRLWRAEDGVLLHEIRLPNLPEGQTHLGQHLAFSADGRQLGWASPTGRFLVWDCATGKQTSQLRLPMSLQTAAIAFTPQGRCLAAGSTAMTDEAESFQLQVWDGITGKRLFATQPQPYPILSLSFTHDGKVLASGGFDRVVTLWDMNSLLA